MLREDGEDGVVSKVEGGDSDYGILALGMGMLAMGMDKVGMGTCKSGMGTDMEGVGTGKGKLIVNEESTMDLKVKVVLPCA